MPVMESRASTPPPEDWIQLSIKGMKSYMIM